MARELFDDGFTKEDADEDKRDDRHAIDHRCTPEKLEAFCMKTLQVTGRFPTLQEIKANFGGVLGAYVSAWELMDRPIWKKMLAMRHTR